MSFFHYKRAFKYNMTFAHSPSSTFLDVIIQSTLTQKNWMPRQFNLSSCDLETRNHSGKVRLCSNAMLQYVISVETTRQILEKVHEFYLYSPRELPEGLPRMDTTYLNADVLFLN